MTRTPTLVIAAVVLIAALGAAVHFSGRGTSEVAVPPDAPATAPGAPAAPPPAQ